MMIIGLLGVVEMWGWGIRDGEDSRWVWILLAVVYRVWYRDFK